MRAIRLMGTCANGVETAKGVYYHAIPERSWKAVCGAMPLGRSAGWANSPDQVKPVEAVTCPKCLKRLASMKDK
jgi:hypothetical protein